MKKVQEQVCVSDRSPQGNAMSHRARGNQTCARADRAAASAREYPCTDRWTRQRASSRPVQLVYGAKCPAPAGFRSAVAAFLAAERQSGLTLTASPAVRCRPAMPASPKPPPASAATPPRKQRATTPLPRPMSSRRRARTGRLWVHPRGELAPAEGFGCDNACAHR